MNINKLLCLGFFCLYSNYFAWSQVLSIADNNCWMEEFRQYGPNYNIEEYPVFTEGDTIVGEITYKKIYKRCEYSYMGGIHVAGEMVYHLPPGQKAPNLIYNFGLSYNQTFEVPTNNWYYGLRGTLKVESIRLVEFDSKVRKLYEFTLDGECEGIYWLEGIGSLGGLLKVSYVTGICSDSCLCTESLTYYSEGGKMYRLDVYADTIVQEISQLPSEGCACSPSIVGISSNEPAIKPVFFPNPVTRISTLHTSQPIQEIHIYDTSGRMIYHSSDIQTNTFSLNRKDFEKGVYYYIVKTQNHQYSGQFIVF